MAQARPPFRRRQYFVKKNFQFGFILKFCILILIGALISTGLLFLFSQSTLTSSFHQSRLVIRSTSMAILPAIIYTNLINLGLITLATILVTLFISHKLAGPLFRFEKELKLIGEGDLTINIHLREKDQITDIAAGLNTMTDSLHEKLLNIRGGIEQLMESASGQDIPQEFKDRLRELHQNIETSFKL